MHHVGTWRKRERCILGTTTSERKARVIADATAADTGAIDKAQSALMEVHSDTIRYRELFKRLDSITHPVNVDILKPFHELEVLASLVKIHCLKDSNEELKLWMDGVYKAHQLTGEKKTSLEALKVQAQAVSMESRNVSEDFGKILKDLKAVVQLATNEQVIAFDHMQNLNKSITALNVVIAGANSRLSGVNSDYVKSKEDLEDQQQKLNELKEDLKRGELYLESYDGRVSSNTGDPMCDSVDESDGLVVLVVQWHAKSLENSIKEINKLLPDLDFHFRNAEMDREKWDSIVKRASELQNSLKSHAPAAERVREEAEHWRRIISGLDNKWSVVHGHI